MNLALSTLAVFVLGGCVAQSEYDKLVKSYRTSEEQIIDLRADLEAAQAHIQVLENTPQGPDQETVAELEAARAEISRLAAELANTEKLMIELIAKTGPLPTDLNDELELLAKNNPQLMSYDKKQGMIKLTSDLTFALGSDNVGDAAAAGLAKLAAILNSPSAGKYEVRIVGHTDNLPIANQKTKAKHPSNWHLSVHRAIAVKDTLSRAGITPVRLSVAGYGQFRPIAPNTSQGERANRRVEIFLVPYSYTSVEPLAEDEPSTSPEPDSKSATAEDPADTEAEPFK